MLFNFFDYLFYIVYRAYSKTKDSSPAMAAVCVVSAMQGFNLLSCLMIYCVISHDKSIASTLLFGGVGIFLIIFNYIRYIYKENKNYKIRDENSSRNIKNLKEFLTVFYIIVSTVLFFGLAIYLGSKKW